MNILIILCLSIFAIPMGIRITYVTAYNQEEQDLGKVMSISGCVGLVIFGFELLGKVGI